MISQDCFDVVKEFMFGVWFETDNMNGWKDSSGRMHGKVMYRNHTGYVFFYMYDHGTIQYEIESYYPNGKLQHKKDTVDGLLRIRDWYSSGNLKYEKVGEMIDENYYETTWYHNGSIESQTTLDTYKEWYIDGRKKLDIVYKNYGPPFKTKDYNGNVIYVRNGKAISK